MFNILRNSQHISQSDYHFTFLRTTHEGSSFSLYPHHLLLLLLLCHFCGCKVLNLHFNSCIFLITNYIEHIFSCPYWSFTYSFCWNLYSKSFPTFIPTNSCKSSLCIMTQVPYQIHDLQIAYILWLAFFKIFIYLFGCARSYSKPLAAFDLCCSMWNP